MLDSLGRMAPRARRIDAEIPPWRDYLVAKPEVTHLTVAEVAQLWLAYVEQHGRRSMADARSAVGKHVVGSFGPLDCRDLEADHVVAWIRAQRVADYSPASIRRHLSYLTQVLEHARRLGALDAANPCRHLPAGTLPPKRARDPHRNAREVLSASQIDALLRTAPTMRRTLWALCVLAGLRFGEAAAVRWGSITSARPLDELVIDRSWDCRSRRFGPTKTGEVRLVPVHPRLRRQIELAHAWFVETYHRAPEAGDLVAPFVHMYRNVLSPQPWHETTALKWWRRDLAEAGVRRPAQGPRKLHCARHTFITLLARAGVQVETRKAMTHTMAVDADDAHSAYVHLDWHTLCAAVVKLGVSP